MLARETIQFLARLDRHNNRDWLQANKAEFETAKEDFANFIGELIGRISAFDPGFRGLLAESCIFRIYRDVRFSQDKRPYKNNFGAYLSPGGRKSGSPGYYFHLQPGQSFLAAGKYHPEAREMLQIRNAIANQTATFFKLLKSASFKKNFGELRGDKLKTAPKGFLKDHPAIEYLKHKSFIVYQQLPDDEVLLGRQFPVTLAGSFKQAKPLLDFLREALANK
jgi:uncharacterized protein (TIGR02453 family)